jgi:hypothetical protein
MATRLAQALSRGASSSGVELANEVPSFHQYGNAPAYRGISLKKCQAPASNAGKRSLTSFIDNFGCHSAVILIRYDVRTYRSKESK